MIKTKERIISWDFTGADTKEYSHCMHNYPAMMIPQIARKLLNIYGDNSKILFDPYCGTGTSLVEANLKGINAFGCDLNPLAVLIAKVKTKRLDLKLLKITINKFNDFIFQIQYAPQKSIPKQIPDFSNINFWFKDDVIKKLGVINHFILNINNKDIKDFFKVAFSETVRESSLTRNSEFKLYRMNEMKRLLFDPDVYKMMQKKLIRNLDGYTQFYNNTNKSIISEINQYDSTKLIPSKLENNKVDIIITSPPYGDSRTTVAYGQFSRLANQWLEIKEAQKIDSILMGGKRNTEIDTFDIKCLDDSVNRIISVDKKRALEVIAFYRDLLVSIENVSKTLKKNGYCCYIVGNRRVKGITLPTDKVVAQMFIRNGYKHIKTITRQIPNKRMPKKNSPTNKIGKLETTMNYEYIVVMKKD